jgi:hypothetical protein
VITKQGAEEEMRVIKRRYRRKMRNRDLKKGKG